MLGGHRGLGFVDHGVCGAPHVGVGLCGLDETTEIPHGFSSIRSASAAASSANFDAQYGADIGIEILPFTLEMNTIRPRDSRSRGSTAWVTANCPITLTSNCFASLGADGLDRAADRDPGIVHHRVETLRQRSASAAM